MPIALMLIVIAITADFVAGEVPLEVEDMAMYLIYLQSALS